MAENKEEKKPEEVKENKKDEKEFKYKIATVGNVLLAILVILFMGTAALTYYLIHTEKDIYDEQYNQLVSNLNQVEEENVVPIANIIDTALSNVTSSNNTSQTQQATNAVSNDLKKIKNEEQIVLYDGLVLDITSMDEKELRYIDNKSQGKDMYVITYYSYNNYAFEKSSLGTLSNELYDGFVKVDNVGKLAISEDYNAIPREVKVVNTIPAIISTNNPKVGDYDTVKTIICDLDGNGEDEYILVLANKETGYSKISLFDSKGAKVADLASIEKSKWDKATNAEYYLSISNVQIADVDNDGVMELLIEIPHSQGEPTISLIKYKNGELQGKTNIECSLIN